MYLYKLYLQHVLSWLMICIVQTRTYSLFYIEKWFIFVQTITYTAAHGETTDNNDGSPGQVTFEVMSLPVQPILQTMAQTGLSHSCINDVVIQNGVTTNQVIYAVQKFSVDVESSWLSIVYFLKIQFHFVFLKETLVKMYFVQDRYW